MEIYTLPNDLTLDDSFAIQVFDYEIDENIHPESLININLPYVFTPFYWEYRNFE